MHMKTLIFADIIMYAYDPSERPLKTSLILNILVVSLTWYNVLWSILY